MHIARRLFVVPLANGNHGKTTLIRALVNQGQGSALTTNQKSIRSLTSPSGRPVDAYVFGRSYQEKEKGPHSSVEAALHFNDRHWHTRELIIMPSHISGITNPDAPDDIDQMIDAAHGAGFDIICAAILMNRDPKGISAQRAAIWKKPWDERWTIPNPRVAKPDGPLDALGRDLWTLICRVLAS